MIGDVQTWYSKYGSNYVKGIFLDEGPTFDPGIINGVTAAYETGTTIGTTPYEGYKSHYQNLYASVHGSPYFWPTMLNGSQWPNEWVLSSTPNPAADDVVLWEEGLSDYYNHWGAIPCGTSSADAGCLGNVQNPPPGWWTASNYLSGYHIAHVIYGAGATDLNGAVSRSWTPTEGRAASQLYVYDRLRRYTRVLLATSKRRCRL